MFAEFGSHQLTHELLVTLMAAVTAIVNARPISAIPTDADEPQPLSPSMLLTMKTRPLDPHLATLYHLTSMHDAAGDVSSASQTNFGYGGGESTFKAC